VPDSSYEESCQSLTQDFYEPDSASYDALRFVVKTIFIFLSIGS